MDLNICLPPSRVEYYHPSPVPSLFAFTACQMASVGQPIEGRDSEIKEGAVRRREKGGKNDVRHRKSGPDCNLGTEDCGL